MRVLASALLVAVLLGGCIGDGSEDVEGNAAEQATGAAELHALSEVVAFEASASDGIALRGHVYLPAGDGPFATLLIYWPYWNHGGGIPSDRMDADDGGRRTMADWFGPLMDAGFAVALVNQRGSGISDGCYSYMNHPVNGPDANAVIDQIAAEPWSNGNVGMYGISYGGATQYAALAAGASAHLKAVVPVSGEYEEWNLLGRFGAGTSWGATVHPSYRDAQQGLGLLSQFALIEYGAVFRPTPEHVCAETIADVHEYHELARTGDKTPFWQARDLRAQLAASKVPTFATNGMTDGEGHILQFEGLWDLLSEERRLLVGQWPHAFPNEDAVGFTRDMAVPWFDHYLRGGPKVVETGVVEYQDDGGEWHAATSWPPTGTVAALFFADDALTLDASAAAGEQGFRSADVTPVPDDCLPFFARYVSPPLANDLLLAGNFEVNLTLTSDLPDGNLAAYLYRTTGDGSCADGAAREVRHAVADLRHRGGLVPAGEDFPTGTPSSVLLQSLPFATALEAGERLVLVIGGGTDPDYLLPGALKPALTVHGGASFLTVPVVEGTLVFDEAEPQTLLPGQRWCAVCAGPPLSAS